jgi:hypothetical protein
MGRADPSEGSTGFDFYYYQLEFEYNSSWTAWKVVCLGYAAPAN